jgi:hypothetical protein
MIKATSAEHEGGTPTLVPDISGILRQGEFPWGIVSHTGIVLKDETPEGEWKRITEQVAFLYEATGKKHGQCAMMLGDLLRWGEEKFGEKYADVIDSTREYMRVQVKTLMNWQWIAGKIAPSRRRENLTLAHHEAVAKLDTAEQDEFLMLADNEGLSVKELKDRIKERHPGKPRASKPKTLVAIDTDKPAAVTDALQIIANHLSDPATEIIEDWKEHMGAIHKVFRRHWQNGHKKD